MPKRKIKKSGLSVKQLLSWCNTMVKKDRLGFICEDSLEELREQLQSQL